MKDRLDKILFDKGIVDSRSKAKVLIEKSLVQVDGKVLTRPGVKISVESEIKVITDEIYVSRSAYKLVEAIKIFKPNLQGITAADIGASTGGFSQILLKNSVEKVYAIDVGHDQLHSILKDDPRVINMEGVNIKFPLELPEKVDLCVGDLSFISLKLVFNNIWDLLKDNGVAIVLIKPQFEAGRERMGKDAVLRNDRVRAEVLAEVLAWFDQNNYVYDAVIDSPITGKDGNQEYLCIVKDKLTN